MNAKLALLLPLISLTYFLQTLFRRRLKNSLKFPLALFSLGIVAFDVFVFLVFTVNCMEMRMRYSETFTCIRWIFPTLDFTVMVVLSLLALAFVLLGIARGWSKNFNYTLGSAVIFLGVAARLLVLFGAAGAISLTNDSSNPLVFEIFSIIIVYGLISAIIYLAIFILGLFKVQIPD